MPILLRRLVAACSILVAAGVFAQTSMTVREVNVRAGPDSVFPAITWLNSQDIVQVQGCIEGFTWCDIVSGRTRGWVNAKYLRNVFPSRVPVVTFTVEAYWDEHFRNRRFYADKAQWVGWGTPGWTPPPPPGPRWRRS